MFTNPAKSIFMKKMDSRSYLDCIGYTILAHAAASGSLPLLKLVIRAAEESLSNGRPDPI